MTSDQAGRHPYDLLSPFLDGELSPDERAEVAIHVEQCAACRASLDDLRLLAAGVAAEEPPVPPADLAARIAGRLDESDAAARVIPIRRVVWRSPLALGSLAAALAGIIVTAVWFSTHPPAMRRQEAVVAQAPAPSVEGDRKAMPGAREQASPAPESVAADRVARDAVEAPPAGVGREEQEAAPGASSEGAPARRPGADPQAMALLSADDARVGQPVAAPRSAAHAKRADEAGSAAAPAPLPAVAAPEARSLQLASADYRAVLSRDGALSLRAGEYACAIPAGPPSAEAAPPTGGDSVAKAVDPGAEIREIFAMVEAEQSRRAAAAAAEQGGIARSLQSAAGEVKAYGPVAAMVLTLTDADGTPLFREAPPPIAARLDRLIRERYFPLMESRCGPLPPELRMEDRPAPE